MVGFPYKKPPFGVPSGRLLVRQRLDQTSLGTIPLIPLDSRFFNTDTYSPDTIHGKWTKFLKIRHNLMPFSTLEVSVGDTG